MIKQVTLLKILLIAFITIRAVKYISNLEHSYYDYAVGYSNMCKAIKRKI